MRLNPSEAVHSVVPTIRVAPQRLSETVEWLLAHEDLDSVLRADNGFFPAFMDRLDQTLDRAFARQCPQSLFEAHKSLYYLYEDNIRPPRPGLGLNQYHPFIIRVRNEIERAWDAFESGRVDLVKQDIPSDEAAFLEVMRQLCASRSLAEHPLFDFLENDADYEQMVEFFLHEGALVLRFCDLMVLSLLGVDDEVRNELAVNFWDEVGNGSYQNRHTELFKRLLRHAGAELPEADELSENLSERLDWQGLAGFNLYVYLGLHRRNYFKYIGGMGVAEYMDPPQYEKILRGCRRVGIRDRHTLAYYAEHAELDVEHGEGWFTNVMAPLVRKYPETRYDMVLGAQMRINTTADYYDYLYRKLATEGRQASLPAFNRFPSHGKRARSTEPEHVLSPAAGRGRGHSTPGLSFGSEVAMEPITALEQLKNR